MALWFPMCSTIAYLRSRRNTFPTLLAQPHELNSGLAGKLDAGGGIISVVGAKLGGSAYAYVYADNDDVYMRYKDASGKTAYASAKTIMELIAAINNMLSKTTTTAITDVSTANAAGALYSAVPSFYAVKNGWCFFHIWLVYTGSVGNWYPFYLPETAVSQHLYFEDGYENNGQLRIEHSGRVRISNTKASTVASHYWGCYPVA